MKISIIGTSNITESHIKTILSNKSNVISISSSRKKSKNLKRISKKFKIKNYFDDWKKNVNFASKNKSSFLISSRIKDNYKILKKCCETGNKILIEKPIFLDPKLFNYFLKYRKQIFVGYNRLFYKNINYLKKKIVNKKNINCIVKCPETSISNISKNSCHIISILFYLFGDLKLKHKSKNKNGIICQFTNSKKTIISIYFNINNADNFSIELFDKKNRYLLSPIENLKIYKKLDIKIKSNITAYEPKLLTKYDEVKMSLPLKPGFDKQFKTFKKFSRSNKIYNDIFLAKKIVNICKLISK